MSQLQLLENAARGGDAAAAMALGKAYLSGHPYGRDLAASRSFFQMAAKLGDDDALNVTAAFLANGTGGDRDWAGALQMLEAHAVRIPEYARQLSLLQAMSLDQAGSPLARPQGNPVGLLPGAAVFTGFLTNAECDYLIDVSAPYFRPSVVVHPQTGQRVADPIRTSENAAFGLALEQPFVHAINRRIAAATSTQPEQGEPIQVLRYSPGQEYKKHFDALPKGHDPRIITFLIYLNTDYVGGETVFPEVDFQIRGAKGDALLFRNTDDGGDPDPKSVHRGMAVSSGTKYLASRWIRAHPLNLQLSR